MVQSHSVVAIVIRMLIYFMCARVGEYRRRYDSTKLGTGVQRGKLILRVEVIKKRVMKKEANASKQRSLNLAFDRFISSQRVPESIISFN